MRSSVQGTRSAGGKEQPFALLRVHDAVLCLEPMMPMWVANGCQWLPVAMGVAMSCPVKHRLSLRFLHGHSLRCGKASLQLVLLLRQGVLRSCQKAKPVSISINSAFVRNIPMTSLYRRITPSLLPTRPFSPRFSLAIFAMECRVIMPRHGGFQSFCLANTANPEPDQQLLWDRRFPDTDG